jgi:catechol 2,3-dioxygenase-like lactoylglutathione lyase family enzyme
MEIQLAMVVLEVRDLDASIAFYRRLELDVPDPVGGRPVTVHRMERGEPAAHDGLRIEI